MNKFKYINLIFHRVRKIKYIYIYIIIIILMILYVDYQVNIFRETHTELNKYSNKIWINRYYLEAINNKKITLGKIIVSIKEPVNYVAIDGILIFDEKSAKYIKPDNPSCCYSKIIKSWVITYCYNNSGIKDLHRIDYTIDGKTSQVYYLSFGDNTTLCIENGKCYLKKVYIW